MEPGAGVEMQLSEQRCAWYVYASLQGMAAAKQAAELAVPCLDRAELSLGHLEM